MGRIQQLTVKGTFYVHHTGEDKDFEKRLIVLGEVDLKQLTVLVGGKWKKTSTAKLFEHHEIKSYSVGPLQEEVVGRAVKGLDSDIHRKERKLSELKETRKLLAMIQERLCFCPRPQLLVKGTGLED